MKEIIIIAILAIGCCPYSENQRPPAITKEALLKTVKKNNNTDLSAYSGYKIIGKYSDHHTYKDYCDCHISLRKGSKFAKVKIKVAVFAGEAGLAFYHVGVEQHWWAGLDACAQAGATPGTVDELRELLLEGPPTPPCDEVQWSLFGVSMAGYNMLYAGVMAGISLFGAAALRRKAIDP